MYGTLYLLCIAPTNNIAMVRKISRKDSLHQFVSMIFFTPHTLQNLIPQHQLPALC